jgi:hypothetical protein
MAHFAEIDENNIVLRVLVIEQAEVDTGNWGDPKRWIQTSYNTKGGVHYTNGQVSSDQTKALRKNYAAEGHTYDPELDAFYGPKPFPSWVLNRSTCLWEAPTPMPQPTINEVFFWDEETLNWKASEVMTNKSPQTMGVTTL